MPGSNMCQSFPPTTRPSENLHSVKLFYDKVILLSRVSAYEKFPGSGGYSGQAHEGSQTINFVKNVDRNICGSIHPWPLRLPWPSRALMALPGGPSFTGLTSHVVRFGRCSFRRASVADFSILSAPG